MASADLEPGILAEFLMRNHDAKRLGVELTWMALARIIHPLALKKSRPPSKKEEEEELMRHEDGLGKT
ncbi:MAG: hypothetical protein Q8P67_14195 [archaeon]|nr:hypothetical protein [archaeon]